MDYQIIEMLKEALDMDGIICGGGIVADAPVKNAVKGLQLVQYLKDNYYSSSSVRDIAIIELMPFDTPMRSQEIAQYLDEKYGYAYPYQKITVVLRNFPKTIKKITKMEKVEYTYGEHGKEITVREEKPITYYLKKS